MFWGCSRYPKCDFTTSFQPVGALHDADGGPVARRGEAGICLMCGAAIELPADVQPGQRLAGGPPDPGALAPRRTGRRGGDASDDGTKPGGRSRQRRTTPTAA